MDVAFTTTTDGKLTFSRDSAGDVQLDDRAAYGVMATLIAEKGSYSWDGTVGTYLHRLTKDGRLTGTKLSAAASDALDQARQEFGVTPIEATPARAASGKWSILLRWRSVGGTVATATKGL